MPIIINGSTGISGVDGSASTPAVQGTDTNTGFFFPTADTIAFGEGGAEAMRVSSSGYLGVGTTSPAAKVHVSGVYDGSSDPAVQVTNTAASRSVQFRIGDGGLCAIETVGATTNRIALTTGGDFQFNSGYGSAATAYGCRAWVNFNGTGAVAIRSDGGVSSITDNGTGDYTVNFDAAMPDVNFSTVVTCSVSDSSNAASPGVYGFDAINPTTSTCRIATAAGGSGRNDMAVVNVAIFR